MKKTSEINLNEKLRSWCEKTTFHAVPNIATNEQIAFKIMWSICLIASIGYCCRILTSSITDYYEYRVLTTFEIVQESSTYFPAITICNLNEYDLSKNKNLSELANYLIEQVPDDQDPKIVLENLKKKFLNSLNLTELEQTRFELKDMLLSCHYNEIKCSSNEFRLIKNELYGNCYMFNSPLNLNESLSKIKSTSKYGPKYGLQIELFIGTSESSSPMSSTTGAILFINNQTNLVRITDPGIELTPGTETNLALNRMFTYKLPYPYSDCIQESFYHYYELNINELNFIKLTIDFTGNYSQSYCIELCYQKFLINKCGCYDSDNIPDDLFQNNSMINHCHFDANKTLCLHSMKNTFYEEKFNENCKQKCPIECERVTYKVSSISTADYPSLFYEKILINNSFIRDKFNIFDEMDNNDDNDEENDYYDLFRKSLLSVNIYYDTDTYEKITETPETNFGTLLANLGGQFGLFLGISLLSFLELFELFIWLIVYLIQKITCLINSKNENL